jgi:hypothetical protein
MNSVPYIMLSASKIQDRRRVQDVALEHLHADQRHQPDDQPGGGFAYPGADAIDRAQETLDVHSEPPLNVREIGRKKAPSGHPAEWCSVRPTWFQIGFFALGPQ